MLQQDNIVLLRSERVEEYTNTLGIRHTESMPSGITSKDSHNLFKHIDLTCRLHRVFNNNTFEHGGRFYGADYQRLNSDERSTILIDDAPTIEIDYSSLHPRMIYHLNHMDYLKDPYDLWDGNKTMRKATKLLFNIALNAKSRAGAINAFRKKLNANNSLVNPITAEMTAKDISYRQLYDRIITVHPIMHKYLGKNYGVILQNKDSMIAEDILWHFTQKNVPCLCIHDSFIVAKKYSDELREQMHEVYRKHMNGYDCITEVKKDLLK